MGNTVSNLITRTTCAIAAGLLFGLVGGANAGVISVAPGSYEVSYDINLRILPTNGGDILDTFIFEWNDSGDFNVDYRDTIAGQSSTNISHVVDFEPTAAFLIGYGLGVQGVGDGKNHLFTLVNSSFANEVIGLKKWSEAFPGVPPEPRIGHNAMIGLLADAARSDDLSVREMALDKITDFVKNEAYRAAFDPAGQFRVLEWTVPIGDVPAPATLALFGLGLAGLGWSRRKQTQA
jgi:hypothetical protein